MVLDYLDGTGDRCPHSGEPYYGAADLDFGAAYAEWLIGAGLLWEPMDGFALHAFAEWCRAQLEPLGRKKPMKPGRNRGGLRSRYNVPII